MFIWTCKALKEKEKKDAELIKSLRGSLDRFISKEPEGLGEHLVNEEHTHREDSLNILERMGMMTMKLLIM